MKRLLMIMVLLTTIVTLAACNGDYNDDYNDENGESNDTDTLEEFTLEELSQYDGKDGADAYVAVEGYVYDVSDSDYWMDGVHQGQVQAGQDLTETLETESPHGTEMLDRVPKIGVLIDGDDYSDTDDNEGDTYNDDETEDDAYNDDDETEDETTLAFTLDELSNYDGLDGNDAYIAVDGDVYDVTDSSYWMDGVHQGEITAGQDLTQEIDEISPHGRSVLDNIPHIGTLQESDDTETDTGGGY